MSSHASSHKVDCPECKRTVKYPDKLAGKRGKCPKCGEVFGLPPLGFPSSGFPLAGTNRSATSHSDRPPLPAGEPILPTDVPDATAVGLEDKQGQLPTRHRRLWPFLAVGVIVSLLVIGVGVGIQRLSDTQTDSSTKSGDIEILESSEDIEILEWYVAESVPGWSGRAIYLPRQAKEDGMVIVAVNARYSTRANGYIAVPSDHLKLIGPDGREFYVQGTGWEKFSAPPPGGLMFGGGGGELPPEVLEQGYVDRGRLFVAPRKETEAGRMMYQYSNFPAIPLTVDRQIQAP